MGYIKMNNCVNCGNCTVNNKGKEHHERHFFIECDLNVWEGQRSVRISEQHANIPDTCPLIVKEEDNEL